VELGVRLCCLPKKEESVRFKVGENPVVGEGEVSQVKGGLGIKVWKTLSILRAHTSREKANSKLSEKSSTP